MTELTTSNDLNKTEAIMRLLDGSGGIYNCNFIGFELLEKKGLLCSISVGEKDRLDVKITEV